MSNKLISVIIPVFNGEKYIIEAIESVISQNQNIEIIVVDDGSTDKSIDIIEDKWPEINIYKQSNQGPGAARNLGLKMANGHYIAFIDADDIWSDNKLLNQINYLKDNPDIDITIGMVEQFITPEITEDKKGTLIEELKIAPGYVTGTILAYKAVFDKVGNFDKKLVLGETIDWFSRARDAGLNIHMSNDIVLKRRIHTTNMGIALKSHRKDYTTMLRAALERKRKAAKNK